MRSCHGLPFLGLRFPMYSRVTEGERSNVQNAAFQVKTCQLQLRLPSSAQHREMSLSTMERNEALETTVEEMGGGGQGGRQSKWSVW